MDSRPQQAPEDGKRAYSTPELRKYGQLAQVTNTLGATGKNDGGGGVDKTGP
jgi:hypothetical protein